MAMIPPGSKMPPDDGAPRQEPGETESEAGHEFTVQVFPDGRLQVYHEVDGQEQDRQDVADIGQALKAVLDGYRSTQSAGDEGDFSAGYQQERGPEPMSGARPPLPKQGMGRMG